MNQSYILAADSARARLFRLDCDGPQSRLVEVRDLENPLRRQRPSEQFSDSRPGLRGGGKAGHGHAVDDRRGAHLREYERRFARSIAGHIADLRRRGELGSLVLAASPSMLAQLRRAVPQARTEEGGELAKGLTSLPPAALHDYLADRGLLPARGRR